MSVCVPNVESNVLPPMTLHCWHYRAVKLFSLSGKVLSSMVGLTYILLAFLPHKLPRGFTGKAIRGMVLCINQCPLLLSLSPLWALAALVTLINTLGAKHPTPYLLHTSYSQAEPLGTSTPRETPRKIAQAIYDALGQVYCFLATLVR